MDIKLNLSYYASIMLDAFKDLLCSQLCWLNRPGPTREVKADFAPPVVKYIAYCADYCTILGLPM